MLITGVQQSLISQPYIIFSPRRKKLDSDLYRGSTLTQQLMLSLILTLGLGAASLAFSSDPIAPVLRVMVFTIGLMLLKEFVRQMNFANLNILVVICCDAVSGVLQIGGLLFLASRGLLNSHNAYWVLAFAYSLASIIWLTLNRQHFTITFSAVRRDIRHNLGFGKWILASGLLYSAGMDSYPWILKTIGGAGMAGIWAACLGIASLGNPLFLGIQNYLTPRLAHAYREKNVLKMQKTVFKASMLYAGCMLVFSLFLLEFGEYLLGMVYGVQYAGHGRIVSLLGFNLVVSSLAFTSSRSLFVMDRTDMDFKTNFIVLMTLVVLGISLVRMFGIIGAAYGLLISNVVSMVLKCGAFALITRQKVQEAIVR
jgi:O-antigen/teichoic acid export membrane protein